MTCPIDARPLVNNAVICSTCEGVLDRALGDLDALLDELDTALTRQVKKRPGRGTGASDGLPLPYDERASEAGRELRDLLKSWAGNVAEAIADEGRFVQLPTPATARSLSAWFMHHVHWIATRFTAADDLYTELMAAANNARMVIDINPATVYVGPCGSVIDGVECVQILYTPENTPTAHCRICGTTWDVAERNLGVFAQAEHVAQDATTLTRSFAIQGIALDTQRIKRWAARGHLTPAGTNVRGKRVYVVAHVARLIRLHDTKQKLSPWPEQEQETA
jgi:hypothetical protein